MGDAYDWQTDVEKSLQDIDAVILNPRREDWDKNWEQSIKNPKFREQVEWELKGLETATILAMYFAPATRAPVTLLELGLHARSGNLLVACPDGYWRKGNVEIICNRFGIPLLANLAELVACVRQRLCG